MFILGERKGQDPGSQGENRRRKRKKSNGESSRADRLWEREHRVAY